MKKKRTYTVYGQVNLLVSITVSAASLDDAMAHAKTLTEGDFVEVLGDHVDGEGLRITGVIE